MKPIPHKQETGDTEGLLCPETPWGPRGFRTAESVPSRSPSLQRLRPVTGTSASPGLSRHITHGRRSGNAHTWVPITLRTRRFRRTWTWRIWRTLRSRDCTWLPGRLKRAPVWKSKHVLFYLEINSSFSVNHTREPWTSSRKVKTIWGAELPAQGHEMS